MPMLPPLCTASLQPQHLQDSGGVENILEQIFSTVGCGEVQGEKVKPISYTHLTLPTKA